MNAQTCIECNQRVINRDLRDEACPYCNAYQERPDLENYNEVSFGVN